MDGVYFKIVCIYLKDLPNIEWVIINLFILYKDSWMTKASYRLHWVYNPPGLLKILTSTPPKKGWTSMIMLLVSGKQEYLI